VPMVLRDGANPFFHEAIGTMIGLASMQPRFLETVGLSAPPAKPGGMIEIEVSGARIRVEPGVELTTLATVLSALRGGR